MPLKELLPQMNRHQHYRSDSRSNMIKGELLTAHRTPAIMVRLQKCAVAIPENIKDLGYLYETLGGVFLLEVCQFIVCATSALLFLSKYSFVNQILYISQCSVG